MKASIEVSFYPLTDQYIPRVWEFIGELNKNKEMEVETNSMSTHLHGDLKVLMGAVSDAIENSFGAGNEGAVVLKVLPNDTRELR